MAESIYDVCECGDYRFQHKDCVGACAFNKPNQGHNGAPDCQKFVLHLEGETHDPLTAGDTAMIDAAWENHKAAGPTREK